MLNFSTEIKCEILYELFLKLKQRKIIVFKNIFLLYI